MGPMMHEPPEPPDADDDPGLAEWEAAMAEAAELPELGPGDVIPAEPEPLAEGAVEASPAPEEPPLRPPPPWHLYPSEWLCAGRLRAPPPLIPRLDISQGRPCGIVGRDGAGKSDAVQAIALGVASGRPIWGLVAARRGRVLHVSYDLGPYAVALRYRRIANGMGVQPHELRDRLTISDHPTVNLSTLEPKAARKEFGALFKGFDLVILDNLRAMIPAGNENDSEFGAHMATLSAASGDAGCAIIYLHHTGKDGGGSGRGTGAIQAGSGAIWSIAELPSGVRKLTQERLGDNANERQKPLWIARTTLPESDAFPFALPAGSPAWRYEATEDDPSKRAKAAADALAARIVAYVTAHPGCSKAAVESHVDGSTEAIRAALRLLIPAKIEDVGDERGSKLRLI